MGTTQSNKNSKVGDFVIILSLPPHASINLKRQLYLSLVRSYLTYCSQLWRPRLIRDIENLERIQRRATKYIIGNNQMDYKSRLLSAHLLPLMHWLELLQDIIICHVNRFRQMIMRQIKQNVLQLSANSNPKLIVLLFGTLCNNLHYIIINWVSTDCVMLGPDDSIMTSWSDSDSV